MSAAANEMSAFTDVDGGLGSVRPLTRSLEAPQS